MGAEPFLTFAVGKTTDDAFKAAVDRAQWDYGHAGYTGTIAEKTNFVLAGRVPDRQTAANIYDWYLEGIENAPDEYKPMMARSFDSFDDKWGPAVCVEVGEADDKGNRTFAFMGWASS